jgi:DHA2 family multidrug resistance protein
VQSRFTADSAFWELALPQAIRGVGLIMTFTSVMQPALRSLPPTLVHAGAALFNTLRNLGGAFGIAALATLHAHAFALHRQELYSAAARSNPHVQGMIAQMQAYLAQAGAPDPERQALMNYAGLLDREALVMTFNDQFLVLAVVIGLSSFAMVFLKPQGAPMPAHQMAEAH